MSGYYVIGGQYEAYNYGFAKTLLGAKRLAGRHDEYWDNWQGWHRPRIFSADDCEMRRTFYRDYEVMVPRPDAQPVAVYRDGRWLED